MFTTAATTDELEELELEELALEELEPEEP